MRMPELDSYSGITLFTTACWVITARKALGALAGEGLTRLTITRMLAADGTNFCPVPAQASNCSTIIQSAAIGETALRVGWEIIERIIHLLLGLALTEQACGT